MKSHTIGEVLNRLKDEFDDITISKIRFLEAEGLISPDRTDSGYRKFTEQDIDRLRYVLRAQRDRYLPLKVIKDELARLDAGAPLGEPATGPAPASSADDAVAGASSVATTPAGAGAAVAGSSLLDSAASDVQLSAGELADATGLTEHDLASLRDHGLLGDGPRFDGDDLHVAKVASRLLDAGLEARHLRMYRQFADREHALVEQLVAPLLRQRNPDSRSTARDHADHLSRAGGELHRALLGRQLRALLRS